MFFNKIGTQCACSPDSKALCYAGLADSFLSYLLQLVTGGSPGGVGLVGYIEDEKKGLRSQMVWPI